MPLDHPTQRLLERTNLPESYSDRLRGAIKGLPLPRGVVHARMPDGSFAVFKDAGGKKRLATFLSKHMSPPGRDVTSLVKERLSITKSASIPEDAVVYSAVPDIDSVMRHGLMSSEALAKNQDLLAIARPDLEDRQAWLDKLNKQSRRLSRKGPNVFFTLPDPAKIHDKHYIKKNDLKVLEIALGKLIKDQPNTRIYGMELAPFPKEKVDKFPKRKGIISHKKVKELLGSTPEELWQHYNDLEGKTYAANVPHAAILTEDGLIDPKYLKALDKNAGAVTQPVKEKLTMKKSANHMVEPSPDGGNYMAVSNLKSLKRNAEDLMCHVDAFTPLPDWVESKLNVAAASIDDVADWFRNGGELNKTADFANEPLAQRAHDKVVKEYGLTPQDGSEYWRMKTRIYKSMGGTFTGKRAKKAEADSSAPGYPAQVVSKPVKLPNGETAYKVLDFPGNEHMWVLVPKGKGSIKGGVGTLDSVPRRSNLRIGDVIEYGMSEDRGAPVFIKKLGEAKLSKKASLSLMSVAKDLRKTAGVYELMLKHSEEGLKPPAAVASAARRGLELRRKASPSNKGGLTASEASKQGIGSGVQRASNLANGDSVSPSTVKRMHSFFSRHEGNSSIDPEHKGKPQNDKGYVSHLLWGGDAGKRWAASQAKKLSEKEAALLGIRNPFAFLSGILNKSGREVTRREMLKSVGQHLGVEGLSRVGANANRGGSLVAQGAALAAAPAANVSRRDFFSRLGASGLAAAGASGSRAGASAGLNTGTILNAANSAAGASPHSKLVSAIANRGPIGVNELAGTAQHLALSNPTATLRSALEQFV